MRDFFAGIEIALAALEFHYARLRAFYLTLALALAVAFAALWFMLVLPPPDFPAGKIITVQKDVPLYQIATELANEHVIESPRMFLGLTRVLHADTSIAAGKYLFKEPEGLLTVVWRLISGDTGIDSERILVQEGMTVREIGLTLAANLPNFDLMAFYDEARPLEGYLYPDTYYIYPGTDSHEVIALMYANYEKHIELLRDKIAASGKSELDIVIMASILEREARGLKEKQQVAGILWNRIKNKMPLQVDAVFGYIKDKETYSPSFKDLKIESPYNTYLNKGLPPGPIASPGYNSLLAALTPATTTYVYYLTGQDGLMHYAVTFAQHKANRAKFLD